MTVQRDPETLLTHLPATKEEMARKMCLGDIRITQLLKKYRKQKPVFQWGQKLSARGTLVNLYNRKPVQEMN